MSNPTQSPNSNNLITENFRAAGRLINEWRDTLSVLGLTGAMATGIVTTEAAAEIAVGREFARSIGWSYHQELSYAGEATNSYNLTQLKLAAVAGSFTLCGMHNIWPHGSFGSAGIYIGIAAVYTWAAGGPKAVWEAYRDVLWDYPRKKGGGGTSQTQKLIDGIKDLGRDAADLVPQPQTPQPVPVRSPRSTAPANL